MPRPARVFTPKEYEQALQMREDGVTIAQIAKKLRAHRRTLQAAGLIPTYPERAGYKRKPKRKGKKRRARQKPVEVEVLNKALAAANAPTPGNYLVTYMHDGHNASEEHPTQEAALAAALQLRLKGAASIAMWREVKFKLTAVVEE